MLSPTPTPLPFLPSKFHLWELIQFHDFRCPFYTQDRAKVLGPEVLIILQGPRLPYALALPDASSIRPAPHTDTTNMHQSSGVGLEDTRLVSFAMKVVSCTSKWFLLSGPVSLVHHGGNNPCPIS